MGGLSLGEVFEKNTGKDKIFKTLTQTLSEKSLETKAKIIYILRCVRIQVRELTKREKSVD